MNGQGAPAHRAGQRRVHAARSRSSDIDPPNGYRISGEGQGGVAGFAKGGAVVTLREDGGATVLNYNVDAQVGGKIAQVGARLIDGTAKKLADEFFGKFAAMVGGPPPAAAVAGRRLMAPVPGRFRRRPCRPLRRSEAMSIGWSSASARPS